MSKFRVDSFFSDQTIQASHRFEVEFKVDNTAGVVTDIAFDKFNNVGFGFPIKPYHVKNVVFPYGNFRKETQQLGTFTRNFSVLKNDGFELKVELQEDQENTIAQFILFLERLVIDKDGFYNPPSKSKIDIEVSVYTMDGQLAMSYEFNKCLFVNATETNYTYDSSTAISSVLSFSAEEMILDEGRLLNI